MRHPAAVLSAVLLCIGFAASVNAQNAPTAKWRALDALRNPIPKALVQLWVGTGGEEVPPDDIALTTTDEDGFFTMPAGTQSRNMNMARLLHADYGTAESRLDYSSGTQTVAFSVVRKGSDAEPRALSGVVLDPENQPVAGVKVGISVVQSSGAESYTIWSGDTVFTDKAGRFRIYPASGAGRKGLIPEGAIYHVAATKPDFALFPDFGAFKNSQEAVIRLVRPNLAHHFVFLGPDGKPLADDVVQGMSFAFGRQKKWSPDQVQLPRRYKSEPVKLAPGWYTAAYNVQKGGVSWSNWYPPIEVTADSPEELVFRLPPPTTFVGRVVDGVTGKPMAGAFVLGARGRVDKGLAGLTDDEWKALRALPAAPALDGPAVQPLTKVYYIASLARTDADGRFAITRESGDILRDVIAFDAERLPYGIGIFEPKIDADGHAAMGDLPLFPAAKVLVKPVSGDPDFAGYGPMLSYGWQFEKEDQPEWIARFPAHCGAWGFTSGPGYIDRPFKLRNGEEQPIFVPALLRLRLEFKQEQGDQWLPRKFPEIMLLKPGEVKKLDDLTITKRAK